MPPTPYLDIHLGKIRHNARFVVELCRQHGIEVVSVVKGVAADTRIVCAIRESGIRAFGDSYLLDLEQLQALDSGNLKLMLIRSPSPSQALDVVRLVDVSLNTEEITLARLSEAAQVLGRTHEVILMVDTGERREGVLPEQLPTLAEAAVRLPGIRLTGIGAELGCWRGIIPSPANESMLAELARDLERRLGITLPVISGGSSNVLPLLLNGKMPAGITQLRIGEAILLGRDPVTAEGIPGTYQDTVTLYAEVIEVKEKPLATDGEAGLVAFPGGIHRNPKSGIRRQALVATGKQEIMEDSLEPDLPGAEILGATSNHLMLDVTDVETPVRTGDIIRFTLRYPAMMMAFSSPYMHRFYRDEPEDGTKSKDGYNG